MADSTGQDSGVTDSLKKFKDISGNTVDGVRQVLPDWQEVVSEGGEVPEGGSLDDRCWGTIDREFGS